jgi:DcuC family C4-dicarboxylate transporter
VRHSPKISSPSSIPFDPAAGPETTRLNPLKALIPLVPVALLLLANAGWPPLAWLRRVPAGAEWERLADALPVVRAMLVGTLLAAAVSWRQVQEVARRLFEGMGVAYGSIISLTITAQCFGAGIKALGVSAALLALASRTPGALAVLAAGFPWALAALGGSGSGAVLTFGETLLAPVAARADAATLAAVACLTGAFGRTMSPVAAVVVYSSGLVGVSPLLLVRRLLPALLAGAAVALAIALLAG